MKNNFSSFTDAYLFIINDILKNGEWVDGVIDPTSTGSNFGTKIRRTKEILAYSYCVTNPINRKLNIASKKLNERYLLANFLWMLTGSNSAELIIPFNSKGKSFQNINNEINSAIGPHVFKIQNGTFQELSRIEQLLSSDPATRRAVIQLFSKDDFIRQGVDIPCYNHIQFFIRGNQLHCQIVMRSQSAFMVMPYDFYIFSLLHEALSLRLKVECGHLNYMCNSIHIYEDEIKRAEAICLDKRNDMNILAMQNFEDETIFQLKLFFENLSHHYKNPNSINPLDNLNAYQLDQYWNIQLQQHFI